MKYVAFLILLFTNLYSFSQNNATTLEELLTQYLNLATDTIQLNYIKTLLGKDFPKYKNTFDYIPSINPLNPKNLKRYSSKFGKRFHPIDKKHKTHLGVDISAKLGTPIHAAAKGTIQKTILSNKGYGNQVIIEHKYGFKTRYAHMFSFIVKESMYVKKGEIIGFVGSSGKSTAAHLHFEILKNDKQIDPFPFCFLDIN